MYILFSSECIHLMKVKPWARGLSLNENVCTASTDISMTLASHILTTNQPNNQPTNQPTNQPSRKKLVNPLQVERVQERRSPPFLQSQHPNLKGSICVLPICFAGPDSISNQLLIFRVLVQQPKRISVLLAFFDQTKNLYFGTGL